MLYSRKKLHCVERNRRFSWKQEVFIRSGVSSVLLHARKWAYCQWVSIILNSRLAFYSRKKVVIDNRRDRAFKSPATRRRCSGGGAAHGWNTASVAAARRERDSRRRGGLTTATFTTSLNKLRSNYGRDEAPSTTSVRIKPLRHSYVFTDNRISHTGS